MYLTKPIRLVLTIVTSLLYVAFGVLFVALGYGQLHPLTSSFSPVGCKGIPGDNGTVFVWANDSYGVGTMVAINTDGPVEEQKLYCPWYDFYQGGCDPSGPKCRGVFPVKVMAKAWLKTKAPPLEEEVRCMQSNRVDCLYPVDAIESVKAAEQTMLEVGMGLCFGTAMFVFVLLFLRHKRLADMNVIEGKPWRGASHGTPGDLEVLQDLGGKRDVPLITTEDLHVENPKCSFGFTVVMILAASPFFAALPLAIANSQNNPSWWNDVRKAAGAIAKQEGTAFDEDSYFYGNSWIMIVFVVYDAVGGGWILLIGGAFSIFFFLSGRSLQAINFSSNKEATFYYGALAWLHKSDVTVNFTDIEKVVVSSHKKNGDFIGGKKKRLQIVLPRGGPFYQLNWTMEQAEVIAVRGFLNAHGPPHAQKGDAIAFGDESPLAYLQWYNDHK